MAMNTHVNLPTFDWDKGVKRYEKAREALGDNAFTETADKIVAGRKAGKAIRKHRMTRRVNKAAKRAMKAPKTFGR